MVPKMIKQKTIWKARGKRHATSLSPIQALDMSAYIS